MYQRKSGIKNLLKCLFQFKQGHSTGGALFTSNTCLSFLMVPSCKSITSTLCGTQISIYSSRGCTQYKTRKIMTFSFYLILGVMTIKKLKTHLNINLILQIMIIFLSFTDTSCTDSDFVCPEEFGYYQHPSDCSKYYVCVFGGPLLESCTGGLMYR